MTRLYRRTQRLANAARGQFAAWLLRGAWFGLLVLGSAGCPVDGRELVESDGKGVGGARASGGYGNPGVSGESGEGGSAGVAEAGHGATGAGAAPAGGKGNGSGGLIGVDAGSSGEAGAGGVVDGCSDLDRNRVADCAETLARNASFAESTDRWQPEADVVVSWKSRQAPQSGLLSVENTRVDDLAAVSMGGTLQCIPAQGNWTYLVHTRLFIPDGQGSGLGGAGLLFFDSSDCSGNPTYGFTSTLLTEVDVWLSTDGSGQAPETTRSMAVRLVSVKPFRQSSFDVWFDDVLVRRY